MKHIAFSEKPHNKFNMLLYVLINASLDKMVF